MLLVPTAALLAGCFGAVVPDGDAGWFRHAGETMLGAGFWDVFADSGLQLGPLYLIVLGIGVRLLALLQLPGTWTLFVLAAAQGAGLTGLGIWTAGRAARLSGAAALPARWALGGALGLAGLVAEAIGNGHPEELLLGLLLARAALLVVEGRGGLAAVLVGLAAGVKQWGVLGAGALVSRAQPGQVLWRAFVTGVMVLVAYGPFYLLGEVSTYDFSWGIGDSSSSLLGLVGRWTGLEDWGLRVIQGAVAGFAGVAVGLRKRGTPLASVIVAVAARLLLDPLRLTYYSGPLLVLLLVWAFSNRTVHATRAQVFSLVAVPLTVLAPYVLSPTLLRVTGTLALLGTAVAVLVVDRLPSPAVDADQPGSGSEEPAVASAAS